MTLSYQAALRSELAKRLPGRNTHSLPALEKIVVNSGVGSLLRRQAGKSDEILAEFGGILSRVCGQRSEMRPARKSVASFSVRSGDTLGLRVTLRRGRMYDFLERLLRLALPRVRDFQGISKSAVDARGNLTIGLRELSVFPEVSALARSSEFGAQVTIVARAKSREEAMKLYEVLKVPFTKK